MYEYSSVVFGVLSMYALSIKLSMHFLIIEMDGAKRALDWLSTWEEKINKLSWRTSGQNKRMQPIENAHKLSNIYQYLYITSWINWLCLSILRLFIIRTIAACKYILRSSSIAWWVCSTSCEYCKSKCYLPSVIVINCTSFKLLFWGILYLFFCRIPSKGQIHFFPDVGI